jgi:23S rRNA (guanosine2251-2'-O)-methyltransferase
VQKTTPKLAVILDNVRSIYNVGSIFRTADAAGADMIWLTGYTPGPDTHSAKMAKTALGAQLTVPWGRVRRAGDLLRKLKGQGVTIVALEQSKESVDYRTLKPKFPLAIIIGNEKKGVRVTSHNIDIVLEIPMRGKKESLNVVVALGIALYELTRRWK